MTDFPPPHPAAWPSRRPTEARLDPAAVAAAASHAAEHETPWRRDLAEMVATDFSERPPWNETLGPVRRRGGPNGLILRGGDIVAEWGDTTQVDMTFSVAKSYLSILAGLAWDRGLFADPHEPVRRTVDDGGFDPPHNDAITWHHLLPASSPRCVPSLCQRNTTLSPAAITSSTVIRTSGKAVRYRLTVRLSTSGPRSARSSTGSAGSWLTASAAISRSANSNLPSEALLKQLA